MNEKVDTSQELIGIRGWLLFFILTRVVIGPPWNAFRTYRRWEGLKAEVGAYAQSSEFLALNQSAWTAYAIGTAIAVATGVLMWTRLKPSSVWMAIVGLWIAGLAVPVAGYLHGLSIMGEQVYLKDLSFLIVQLLSVGLWTSYLLLSKRVKNTYDFRRHSR